MFRTSRFALLLGLWVMTLGGNAFAQDRGRVGMHGAIIETACAIHTDSRDQTVEMVTMPINHIVRDGQGQTHPFTVKLANCSLSRLGPERSVWRYFQITFDGRLDAGVFGLEGSAQGVALQITDGLGNVVRPGKPLTLDGMALGEKILNYSTRLVGNNQVLRAGAYYSAVRFRMDYY